MAQERPVLKTPLPYTHLRELDRPVCPTPQGREAAEPGTEGKEDRPQEAGSVVCATRPACHV